MTKKKDTTNKLKENVKSKQTKTERYKEKQKKQLEVNLTTPEPETLGEKLDKLCAQTRDLEEKINTLESTLIVSTPLEYAKTLIESIFGPKLTGLVNLKESGNTSENNKKNAEILKEKSTDLDKDQVFLCAYYLSSEGYLCGNCSGVGKLGFFKNPSGCGGCSNTGNTVNILGLWEYFKFLGSREYTLKEGIVESTYENSLTKNSGEEFELKKKELDNMKALYKTLNGLIDNIINKTYIYSSLRSDIDTKKMEKEVPHFVDYIQQIQEREKSKIIDKYIDIDNKTMAILSDYSYYSGSGGIEYGVTLDLVRGDNKIQKKIVYRDAYNPNKDNRNLSFNNIDTVNIEGDNVVITLKNGEYTQTYSFLLPYTEKQKNTLDDQKQIEFLEYFEQTKEELIEAHTRKGMMADYIPFVNKLHPTASGKTISYKKAEVIDGYIDILHGEGYIVIKAQIDATAGDGMQFERVKYKITPSKVELLDRICAYESALASGTTIRMQAYEPEQIHMKDFGFISTGFTFFEGKIVNQEIAHEVLGLHIGTPFEQIKKTYKEFSRLLHPDINKHKDATKNFQKLQEAYSFLEKHLSK